MKKHILILKYAIALGISISLFSCKKQEDVSPVVTGTTIYRPTVVYDSYDNHLIDYSYDESNRVKKSTYYTEGSVKTLFNSITSTWYYDNSIIFRTDTVFDIHTNKLYNCGHDSIFMNIDNEIEELRSSHDFWYSLTNPEFPKAAVLGRTHYTYINLADSLNVEISYKEGYLNDTLVTWNWEKKSALGLNKLKTKSAFENTYLVDSTLSVYGQFLDTELYSRLLGIQSYITLDYLPTRIKRPTTGDVETITWEFDNQNRPIRARVYSANEKSFIKSFRFSY